MSAAARWARGVYRALLPRTLRSRIRRAAGMDELDLHWKLGSGVRVSVRDASDWYVYNEIFVEGQYDAAIDAALAASAPRRPLRVLDLGANVGFFTLRFIDRLRAADPDQPFSVTLVEALPALAREAEARVVEANALAGSARVVNGLVGRRDGSAHVAAHEFSARTRLDGNGGGTRMDYVDLEGLFADGEEIDLLKCDIEGSEEAFVESYGTLLRRVRTAVFELHPDLCDTERCRALLRAADLVERPAHAHSAVALFTRSAPLRPGLPPLRTAECIPS